MKKQLFLLFIIFNMLASVHGQIVTTVPDVSVCTGASTVQLPVTVTSFTAVGSITLRFSYVTTELTSPSIVYTDPGLAAWGTFLVSTSTPGTIIISAFDPDYTEPTGLTLADNTTLFTLQFNIVTITTPAGVNFIDNIQGTWLEYGGIGPDYTPFEDDPQNAHYIDGSVTVVPDPSWTAYSFPTTSICNGGSVSFSVGVNDGLGGTISWTRSTTQGGAGTTVTSPDSPGIGTWYYRPQYTPTGEGCDLADGTETTVTVAADPSWTNYSFPTTTICTGGSVTFSVSVNDGLGGTITWIRSGTAGGAGTAVTSPDSPGIGTWYYRPQYTPNGEGCNLADGTETTVTVVADPVAPGLTKDPDLASVCQGDVLTVSTTPGSGGAGTVTDEYRYSTDNGTTWSAWSTSVPSFASVAGTNKIQSHRTATATGCDESSVNEVSWTVNARQKISGYIYYHKTSGDVILDDEDITLKLYKTIDDEHSNLLATVVSDANGYYEFTNLCPDCDYDIVATSTHATDYAINSTDAAQVNYWGPAPYLIEKVRFHAGDVVGPNLTINSTDALKVQGHFVNGETFDRPAWTFWKKGETILQNPVDPGSEASYPNVNLQVGLDAEADLYGLVTGDFNRSFDPTMTKAASASLNLAYNGNRQVNAGQLFELPIRLVNDATIGAVSLILDYPLELAEIQDITMNHDGGIFKWALDQDEIRISWISSSPASFTANTTLLTLQIKTTDKFVNGEVIRLSLASDPLNELADGNYNIIGDAWLSVETIEASALGLDEKEKDESLFLSCYPNPSHNYTIFTYSLPYEGSVILNVNDLPGNRLVSLVNEKQARGNHLVKFDTESLPKGIYVVTLRLKTVHDEEFKTIKLINN